MATVEFVTSENGKEGARVIKLAYDFGASIAEAVEKFGEASVLTGFIANAKVDAQALVRRKLNSKVKSEDGVERDYTDEEIAADLAAWKPGVKAERSATSVADKAEALFGKMTEAQKAELLAKLQAMAGA